MHPVFHEYNADLDLGPNTGYNQILRPRTDGLVYKDYASFGFRHAVTIGANEKRSVGVFLQPPETEEFTPYRVNASVVCAGDLTASVFCGIGAGAPNASTSGQVTQYDVLLATGLGSVNIDKVFCVPKPGVIGGTDFSSRPLVFHVTFINPTTGPVDTQCVGRLAVERMVSPMPQFHDRRIG